MGSFNVACSISSLSINEGDRVKYFILKGADINISNIEGMLTYPHTLAKPVCLPVSGTYDDYGRVKPDDNINNKIVEKYFNQDISEITDNISQGDGVIGESYSGMFVLEEVYNKLVEFSLKDNSLYNSYVSRDVLDRFGFRKVLKEEQFFFHPSYKYLYRNEERGYDLFLGNYGCTLVPLDEKQYCVADHRYLKEIYSCWSDLTGLNKETFPIDINSKEYNSKDSFEIVNNKLKDLTGITIGHAKNSESIYSVKDFEEIWINLTGIKVDVEDLKSIYVYDKNIEEAIERLSSKDNRLFEYSKLSDLLDSFRGWQLFNRLYTIENINDDIKVQIRECMAFDSSMYSCNRFYFPAMNGEQCGNSDASKELLNVSMSIINERLKNEDEEEDEETNC